MSTARTLSNHVPKNIALDSLRFRNAATAARSVSSIERALYGAEPQVVVPHCDAPRLVKRIRALGVSVLVFHPINETLTDIDGSRRLVIELPAAPSCPLVLVACSDAGREAAAWLDTEWQARGIGAPPTRCYSNAGRRRGTMNDLLLTLSRRLLERAEQTNAALACEVVTRYGEVTSLRTRVAELEATLADYQIAIGRHPDTQVVVCDPAEEHAESTNPYMCTFPFRTWGLSRVDLYFTSSCLHGDGVLTVTLSAADDVVPLAQWARAYRHIQTGWNSYMCARALVADSHYMTLRIDWCSTSGEPPRLHLSSYRIQLEGEGAWDSPAVSTTMPALRLWTNLPALERET
jgi:hypothetical protein